MITICVLIIAILHGYFFLLEAVFWQKPLGLKVFHLDPEFAKRSSMLAANQGVYNLFLSAGLIWSVTYPNPNFATHLQIFFLACVAIAGIFGGITVNKRIFIIQALPALLTLCALFIMNQ